MRPAEKPAFVFMEAGVKACVLARFLGSLRKREPSE
jgi:hypothetical protein